jgi:hypothetical protein
MVYEYQELMEVFLDRLEKIDEVLDEFGYFFFLLIVAVTHELNHSGYFVVACWGVAHDRIL